jgi:fumarate reductase flavoprotein subunit
MRIFLLVQLTLCGGLVLTGCGTAPPPPDAASSVALSDTYDTSDLIPEVPGTPESFAPDSSLPGLSSIGAGPSQALFAAIGPGDIISMVPQAAIDVSDATQTAPDVSDATQASPDVSDAPQTAPDISDATQTAPDMADAIQFAEDIADVTQGAVDSSDMIEEADDVYLSNDMAEDDVVDVDEPVTSVDVLVVGAGPAGLSAAWEARLAGASVVVLEMGEEAGGGGSYAYHFFAGGTSWQKQKGYPNSIEDIVAEWPEITCGGNAADPLVSKFLLHSAETLLWLVNDLGAEVAGVGPDNCGDATPTSHLLHNKGKCVVGLLVDSLADETWLQHRAEALAVKDGAVVGAEFTDLGTGAVGWVEAKTTIIATGGFARDFQRILKDRPELEGTLLVYDNHPLATGAGHPLLEQVGAQFQNQGRHSVYIHSMADYRPGFEDEALLVLDLFDSVIVDSNGKRVFNEYDIMGFEAVEKLVSAPDKRLWAVLPEKVFLTMIIAAAPYNWANESIPEELSAQDLLDSGAAWGYGDLESLAAEQGFDEAGLQSTIELYDSYVAKQQDDDFGKPMSSLSAFNGGPYYVVELAAGTAKAFGGVTLSEKSEVLDPAGDPIPGLYGAGEVAGMLGTPAVGKGFDGSITACYYTGRVAGQNAAAEALLPSGD